MTHNLHNTEVPDGGNDLKSRSQKRMLRKSLNSISQWHDRETESTYSSFKQNGNNIFTEGRRLKWYFYQVKNFIKKLYDLLLYIKGWNKKNLTKLAPQILLNFSTKNILEWWHLLASFGNFWHLLASFGTFWHILAK